MEHARGEVVGGPGSAGAGVLGREMGTAEMTLEVIRSSRNRLAGSIGRVAEILGLLRSGGRGIQVGPETLGELCEEAVLRLREQRDDWQEQADSLEAKLTELECELEAVEARCAALARQNTLLEREIAGAFEIAKGYSDAQADTIRAVVSEAMQEGAKLFGRGLREGRVAA